MQGQDGSGMWMYQCILCKKLFDSSQGLAGHSKGHLGDGWVKGTPHRKVFFPYPNHHQQQQGSSIQQAVSADTDSTNAQLMPKAARPPSPRRPPPPKHHLRLRDLKILARLKARLTKEEQDIILRLVHSAMEQAKQSSMKSNEVEVIPNKDSEAALVVGTTKTDVVTIEDLGDE